jgi:hypothetical protein
VSQRMRASSLVGSVHHRSQPTGREKELLVVSFMSSRFDVDPRRLSWDGSQLLLVLVVETQTCDIHSWVGLSW